MCKTLCGHMLLFLMGECLGGNGHLMWQMCVWLWEHLFPFPAVHRGLQFLHVLITFSVIRVNINHSKRCALWYSIVVLICISLWPMMSRIFMYLFPQYIFFVMFLFISFAHLKDWVVQFLIWEFFIIFLRYVLAVFLILSIMSFSPFFLFFFFLVQ
jgi:hypothetical protein